MHAVAGFLGFGYIVDDNEFEETLGYARVEFTLSAYNLGTIASSVPDSDARPVGQAITHAGVFTAAEDGELLMTFPLLQPYAVVPQASLALSPRLHLLFSIELAVNATMLGGDPNLDLLIEPGEPIGAIDGQVVTACTRLTVVDGALTVAKVTPEQRAVSQQQKLAARRATRAAGRAAFLSRHRQLKPQPTRDPAGPSKTPPASITIG